jgi:type II secretory pathway component PulM
MWRQLLEVLTLGFYDPMNQRVKEAETEIARLKSKAHRMDTLHPEMMDDDRTGN